MIQGLTMSSLSHIADAFFLRTLDSLVIGVLIAMFAAVLLRVMRKQNSAARFGVWFSALVAIAVLPGLDGELWSSLAHGQKATSAAVLTVPSSWALYFLAVWGVVAAIALARVGASLIHLYTVRKSFTKVDLNRLDRLTREMLERHRPNRVVDFCTSGQVSVPTAIGLIRPAVVIPEWLMEELSPDELNQILLHELAHLRRWDDWTNLTQKIVKALFFFHPAVWWIEKKISLEREMACDDAVLAESASPRAYAECLVHLAEKSVIRRGVALAQAAVGKIRQMSLRVAQILNADRAIGTSRGWKPAAALVAGFAVLNVAGISRAPRLVAFQEVQPRTIMASLPHAATLSEKEFAAQKTPTPYTQVVNANFITHPVRALNPASRLHNSVPPRAVVASDRRKSTDSEFNAAQFVHLTEFNVNPTAGAMFVVVEQDAYQAVGQAIYRVSVWRIVVLPAANSAGKIPRKET